FIGYARTPTVTEKMLENMFLGDPPGNYDRILDFSTPVTGTLFFAPAADFLDDLPDLPGAGTATEAAATPDIQALPDGSLGIGDLKRGTTPGPRARR
ncbi:MAG: Dyp-type peroxidase, partial [Actinomycetota bacterium]|nr:Dyp-type peroxidase [Actinomycetota bacterium]